MLQWYDGWDDLQSAAGWPISLEPLNHVTFAQAPYVQYRMPCRLCSPSMFPQHPRF